MSDIVQRLRNTALRQWKERDHQADAICDEAADEIERLQRLILIVNEMVGEDIKAYCSEQTNREWQTAVRELEADDE